MNEQVYRILYEGERWFGSNAGSCKRALRRLGQTVLDLDVSTSIPTWSNFGLRLARRLILPLAIQEHNQKILFLAREFKPHIFFAFKGANVMPSTLKALSALGIARYNYYPDVSAFSHKASTLPRSLQMYDCVFSTKLFLAEDLAQRGFPLQHWEYLPHGYDPDAHHPVKVEPEDLPQYGAEVAFIGGHTPGKEQNLASLKRLLPDLDLAIWGDRWQRSTAPELKPCIRHRGVIGVEYMKTICATKIMLGLLSEQQVGSSRGDQVTSRTFNIPACGAFMLHERTEEVARYFDEGREIEGFGSPQELAEKIRFYLEHPTERQAIAQAGYRRCVPAYSHDQRMRFILEWHRQHRG